jgi:hypothetical protein
VRSAPLLRHTHTTARRPPWSLTLSHQAFTLSNRRPPGPPRSTSPPVPLARGTHPLCVCSRCVCVCVCALLVPIRYFAKYLGFSILLPSALAPGLPQCQPLRLPARLCPRGHDRRGRQQVGGLGAGGAGRLGVRGLWLRNARHIHVRARAHTYTHKHTNTHTHIHRERGIYRHTHNTHAHARTHTDSLFLSHTHTHTHALTNSTHTRAHTRAHTHTRAHAHTDSLRVLMQKVSKELLSMMQVGRQGRVTTVSMTSA